CSQREAGRDEKPHQRKNHQRHYQGDTTLVFRNSSKVASLLSFSSWHIHIDYLSVFAITVLCIQGYARQRSKTSTLFHAHGACGRCRGFAQLSLPLLALSRDIAQRSGWSRPSYQPGCI